MHTILRFLLMFSFVLFTLSKEKGMPPHRIRFEIEQIFSYTTAVGINKKKRVKFMFENWSDQRNKQTQFTTCEHMTQSQINFFFSTPRLSQFLRHLRLFVCLARDLNASLALCSCSLKVVCSRQHSAFAQNETHS